MLHAFSDPVRLKIVAALAAAEGEHTCGSFDVPVTKSTCTHHFKVLREAGVIQQRQEGTARLNTLRRDDLEARFPGLLSTILQSARLTSRGNAKPGHPGLGHRAGEPGHGLRAAQRRGELARMVAARVVRARAAGPATSRRASVRFGSSARVGSRAVSRSLSWSPSAGSATCCSWALRSATTGRTSTWSPKRQRHQDSSGTPPSTRRCRVPGLYRRQLRRFHPSASSTASPGAPRTGCRPLIRLGGMPSSTRRTPGSYRGGLWVSRPFRTVGERPLIDPNWR